jgi:hypothetical protein
MAEAKREEHFGYRLPHIEIVSAAVLAIGGLLTTWAGYQSSLWNGVQQSRYTEFGAFRQEAAQLQLEANQLQMIDVVLFSAWLEAQASEQWALATFYRERFPPKLKTAFEDWRKVRPLKDAPPSPFAMPIYQRIDPQASKREALATATYARGQEANAVADKFSQGNVMLAMAMFFAGISQTFRVSSLRVVLVGVAVATCGFGVVRVLTLPILQPG